MAILIIDNYDSFTFNLKHYVEQVTDEAVDVVLNDGIPAEITDRYNAIIISPGPGIPDEAGITKEVIRRQIGRKKILGVCLGHQAIAEVLGARLINLDRVHHGISSALRITGDCPMMKNIPLNFFAGRYHSWVIDPDTLPDDLIVTALDENGEIMAMRHREFPLFGVQFHPESIMTPQGLNMIRNFIEL